MGCRIEMMIWWQCICCIVNAWNVVIGTIAMLLNVENVAHDEFVKVVIVAVLVEYLDG